LIFSFSRGDRSIPALALLYRFFLYAVSLFVKVEASLLVNSPVFSSLVVCVLADLAFSNIRLWLFVMLLGASILFPKLNLPTQIQGGY